MSKIVYYQEKPGEEPVRCGEIHNYYRVELGDMLKGMTHEELVHLAISYANDTARIKAENARWTFVRVEDESVYVVRRTRYREMD